MSFHDQHILTIGKQNDLRLDDHYPSNHFPSGGDENQACNCPPASDSECLECEQPTRIYGQSPGFQYQQLDDNFGKPEEHTVISQARPVSVVFVRTERFSNMLILSILSIFCCPPTGIAAIVQAFKARSAENRGEIIQAHHHALSFFSVSLAIGILMYIWNFIVRF